MREDDRTFNIVMTGLMTCLVCVATWFIKIPVPMTKGYVHLGDSMVFLSVLILGKKRGALASGMGSGLADLFAGYVHWMPWTIVIKFFMAFIMGIFLESMQKKGKIKTDGTVSAFEVLGMIVAGAVMVAGYYVAAAVIDGNWLVPLASVPWNIGQFVAGLILAIAISAALYHTPAKKYFRIK